MSVDEGSRHQLYQRLESALGVDEATTLMEHLPPTGWGNVARKSDIDTLRHDHGQEFALVRAEAQSFRVEMGQEFALCGRRPSRSGSR